MPEDPFILSPSSVSKLNSLRFQGISRAPRAGITPTVSIDGTALLGKEEGHVSIDIAQELSNDQDRDTHDRQSRVAEIPPLNKSPETPAHRIPLADLVSNIDNATNQISGKIVTPDDHLYWDHRDSFSRKRAHKRNRSMSPCSSPSNLVPNNRLTPNSRAGEIRLRTPQHDIAADLWSCYVGNRDNECQEDASSSNLVPSTPIAVLSRKNKDSSVLRRTNSCNIDWPTSASKRRCVDAELQQHGIRDLFSRTRSELLGQDQANSSRVGRMVGQIQQSFLKTRKYQPKSSKVLFVPEISSGLNDNSHPPNKRTKMTQPINTPSKHPTIVNPPHMGPSNRDVNRRPGLEEPSSEFGDDDLDDEFLDLAVASTNNVYSVETHISQNFGEVDTSHPSYEQSFNRCHDIPTIQYQKDASDEYDEFNDDFDFADSMEQIIAYDTKPPKNSCLKGAKTSRQHTEIFDNGSDSLIHNHRGEPEGETNSNVADGKFAEMRRHHQSRRAIKRYLVLDFAEHHYSDSKARVCLQKILAVEEDKTKIRRTIVLRDSWFDSECSNGSFIHLLGEFDCSGQCVVDDENNAIVLHPDHLISATVVADSFACSRRAVLQDRTKATSQVTKPQVYGLLLHEIFQEAMKVNTWDLNWLGKLIDKILSNHIEDLFELNVEHSEAASYLAARMPALKDWARTFIRPLPTDKSMMDDRNGSVAKIAINKLLEVEEHIWSPMYGLKGNIDATVQVVLEEEYSQRTLTVPLEVKTGKFSGNQSHRAQTALYSLLLSDRYDIGVTFGVLFYLELSKTHRIRAIPSEIRQMIQQRNLLAGYLRQNFQIPPMLRQPRVCSPCYAKKACFVYHKFLEDGDEKTSEMGKIFQETVGHLSEVHQTFFRKWDTLLTLEEKEMSKFKRELWTMASDEREDVGRCFGNISIEPGSEFENTHGPKINKFQYTFVKPKPAPGFSFTESQLSVGEPIVVSDEKGHFALANGYVVYVHPRKITVVVDRRLHHARVKQPGFDAVNYQSFNGIMDISKAIPCSGRPSNGENDGPVLYRLDKDEFSNGMAIVRNNILAIMDNDRPRATRLRELIISLATPSFTRGITSPIFQASIRADLNVDQKRAIEKVLNAEDYALVLGMPGTGKTTTIAQLILALVSQGKSVLLTSYTHTAVDNILLKIRGEKMRILRIGALGKIHPEVQQFVDLATSPKSSIEELRDLYEKSNVVATTCLGVSHRIFNARTFDYCIVDEASQITLPVCLGPIRMAEKFILVGDHYQLPPLVQSREAIEGGLDLSLFKLLCDTHPSSVVNLEHQYRMCKEIMSLSNTLIYSGKLKCGTPAIASRSLNLPDIDGLKKIHPNPLASQPLMVSQKVCLNANRGPCWLRDIIDPKAKVRFINTDTLGPEAVDFAKGSRIVNELEAVLCAQLVEALLCTGVPARDIGVVTLYRSQLSLLKQKLRHHLPDLEMHTADRFQGRDKEVIVMSCVRSNPDRNVGDLLRDWRRVNVAFTRARTKMIIIGSKATLADGNELLGKFVRLVEQNEWCYDLPAGAATLHSFQEHDSLCTQRVSSKSPQQANQILLNSSKGQKPPGKPLSQPRLPLSPLKSWGKNARAPLKPQKMGGKLMDGAKIIRKRPVLNDVLNDMLG
ncbi:Tripartite DNA replication factor [Myotisia sp. PD_48]|nr:Tripartite DNA replication factor [Myotisia sp. PD_48]